MTDLAARKCRPCEGGVSPLAPDRIEALLAHVDAWQLDETGRGIGRDFRFIDFRATMAFVNAIAGMADDENHHPDLEIGYGHCRVRYTTHAIDGLSDNDFICAAKVDRLAATAAGRK